ncbi:MAG: hypothetical protein JRN15_15235 [Nitrososphaerota archaeon]|nr:hypothetical protein [Nitrososphaerota archaeon]
MSIKYNVRVQKEDTGHQDSYLVRKSVVSNGAKRTYPLAKSFKHKETSSPRSDSFHLNEIFLRLNDGRLSGVNRSKDIEDWLLHTYAARTSSKKFNVPFVNLHYASLRSKKMIAEACEILTDFIYANPATDLIVPPIIEFPDKTDHQKMYEEYTGIVNELTTTITDTVGDFKAAFFIPEFLNRNQVPKLLNFYSDRFGEEPLVIVDHNGRTFTSNSNRNFLVLRTLKREFDDGNFAVYCFNLKARKRSGGAVPSEDFLAFYNGMSFIGPSHKPMPIPKDVREARTPSLGKMFIKEDLLYHPLLAGDARNSESFPKEIQNSIPDYSGLSADELRRLNDIHTEERLSDVVNDTEGVLTSLTSDDFRTDLSELSRKRRSALNNKSVNDFFG